MASYTFNGKTYKLRLDLDVLEKMEDEYGGLREAFQAMSGGRGRIKTIKKVFAMMANAANEWEGIDERITGNELKHADMQGFTALTEAIQAAVIESSHAETARGGEANSDTYDAYMAEMDDEEKKRTDGPDGSVSSSDTP